MTRASPETSDESSEDSEDELVLEGQTVVNGPDLLPNVGTSSDDADDESSE